MKVFPHKKFIHKASGDWYKVLNGAVLKLVNGEYIEQDEFDFRDVMNKDLFRPV